MLFFFVPFSTDSIRDLVRPAVLVSGVALLLAVAIAGVGEAKTNARSLTVFGIGSARRTIYFNVGDLGPIETENECCPFGLRALVMPLFVDS